MCMELKSFIRCQIIHLLDRTDLFKGNFVYGGKEIVTILQKTHRERQCMAGIVS